MSGLAFDLQEIPVNIDRLDATDSVDRNLQSCYNLSAGIASVLRAIRAGGATHYLMPTHVGSGSRATYEASIDNANSAMVDAITAFKLITTLT